MISAPPVREDRLSFVLPDFTRHTWVGDAARRAWEPRLARIRRAFLDAEWRSVHAGVRRCGLLGLTASELAEVVPRWTEHRLSAVDMPMGPSGAPPGMIFACVGELGDVTRAREAWVARDDDTIGSLFGYPECCRRFFREVWVGQRCIDTTWPMAAGTAAPERATVTLEAGASNLANILWRWLGVRAVPHLPCRFDCEEAVRFGERMLEVAERAGHAEEAQWIREILSWPVEWSALHGIAEVKTPILKVSTRTDATAGKYVVRWKGTAYPEEGARGLRFPYPAPARRPMTEGRSFQLGIKRRPVGPAAPDPDDYHRDNGFSSLASMTELHQPIVALARRELDGVAGHVLDLGCGNGALLAKICDGRGDLTPHGVDANRVALDHAASVVRSAAATFTAADLFDTSAWSGRRYALALLMAGRLCEVERPRAERLVEALAKAADAILVYAYPGPGTEPLSSLARDLGLAIEEPASGIAAMVARAHG